MKPHLVSCLVALLGMSTAGAQNLDNLGKNKDITMSGGVAVNTLFYANNGINTGRTPFNYFVSGNMNLNLFGVIDAPFAFNFSNQSSSFRQPFNQFALRPTYKGATLHLGTASLIFNPYTLAGHRFNGVGAEYRMPHSPLYLGVMVGNLRDAIAPDSLNNSSYSLPSYRRRGWAAKLGYDLLGAKLEASMLKASDDVGSIPRPPARFNLLPEENVAWSLRGSRQFFDRLTVEATYATTLLSTDKQAELLPDSLKKVSGTLFGLFRPRVSSITRHAYKVGAQYALPRYNVGVEFEHVDPGYRTLGAYYFLNDFENYTANVSGQMLNGRLSLIASGGLQRDNLAQAKLTTLRRFIGMAGLTYVPSERLNLSLNYSNFSSYTNMRTDYERLAQVTTYNALDTISYRQISQNITGSVLYTMGDQKERQQTLMLNAVYQTSGDQQGSVSSGSTVFYNTSLGYTYGIPAKNFTVNTQFYLSGNQFMDQSIVSWGPYVSVQKTYGKALSVNGTVGYNQSGSGGPLLPGGKIINLRGGLNYRLSKQGQLSLDLVHLRRQYATLYSETTVTIGLVQSLGAIRLIGSPRSTPPNALAPSAAQRP